MAPNNLIERVEPRRLFTFAAVDKTFGENGFAGTSPDAIVTPLADGERLVYDGGALIYRYPATGGSSGLWLQNGHGPVAIDAKTGNYAVVTVEAGTKNNVISLYSKTKNKLLKQRSFAREAEKGAAITVRDLAFDASGNLGFVMTARRNTTPGNTSQSVIAYKFDGALNPVTSFGGNGRVDVQLEPDLSLSQDTFTFGSAHFDNAGRLYVRYDLHDTQGDGNHYIERTLRLTANGVRDADYGNGGIATVYDVPTLADGLRRTAGTADRAIDAKSGATYTLGYTLADTAKKPRVRYLTLYRTDAAGNTRSIRVGRELGTAGEANLHGAIGVGPDGHVYAASAFDGDGAQVFNFTLDKKGKMVVVDDWSSFGDARQVTTNIDPTHLAVDGKGTIYLSGRVLTASSGSTGGIIALRGTTTFADVPKGAARVTNGDTLVVNGTDKPDTISVNRRGSSVFVTINDGTPIRYADARRLKGVVILGGKGDDVIETQATALSAFIDGGAGNDRIDAGGSFNGSGGNHTLVGGDGDDRLTADFGRDHLYGQKGNDTLFGGAGADELFGGDGNDNLFASGRSGDVTSNDNTRDLLDAGKGSDFVRLDTVPRKDRRYDDYVARGDGLDEYEGG